MKNTIEDLSFRWKEFQVEKFKGEVEITTTPLHWTIKISRGSLQKIVLPWLPQWFLTKRIELHGTLHWDRHQHNLKIDGLSLKIPQMGNLLIDAFIPLEGVGTRIQVRGKKLSLIPLLSRESPSVKGFSPKCLVDLNKTIKNPSLTRWDWKGSIQIYNGSYSDSSFLYSGEKLALTCSTQGSLDVKSQKLNVKFRARISQGEVLLNRFYFDFNKTPLTLNLKSSLANSFQKLRVDELKVHLKSILECSVKGSVDDLFQLSGARLQASFPSQPLGPFIRTFLKEPFGEETPWLKRTQWQGNWMWNLSLSGSLKKPLITGLLQLQNVILQDTDRGMRIGKTNGDIPFWLDFANLSLRSEKAVKMKKQNGYLKINGFKISWFTLPSLSLHFKVFSNGLRLSRPLKIPLGKDVLKVQDLELRDILWKSRQGHLSVQARRLHLDSLLKKWLGQSFPATVGTDQLELSLQGDQLSGAGHLLLEVFSGKVQIENFRIHRFLSSGQVFALDAQWSNIDLEQLTQITEFGKITGRLEGRLKGFKISYGTPLAFEMILRSVPTKGVSQRISVTAVDNLAQISTEQSPFQGITGGLIGTFFKDFFYKKIEIRCTLKNDYFSVRGLIQEGDKEYLIKGSRIRGVNIINRSPDNRIAWDDMIRRLQRINRSEASAQP
jgi:hypothetical protein